MSISTDYFKKYGVSSGKISVLCFVLMVILSSACTSKYVNPNASFYLINSTEDVVLKATVRMEQLPHKGGIVYDSLIAGPIASHDSVSIQYNLEYVPNDFDFELVLYAWTAKQGKAVKSNRRIISRTSGGNYRCVITPDTINVKWIKK